MIDVLNTTDLALMAEALRPKGNNLVIVIDALVEPLKELNQPGMGVPADDEEYHDILDALCTFLSNIERTRSDKKLLKLIGDFISDISWDNWQNEPEDGDTWREKDGYYTIGSVWYNKLTWVAEGCSNEKASAVASAIADTIKPYLDHLEEFYNLNNK